MAKILLVDDEPRIARVVRDMVEGAEWQFAYADNGADALDAVAREAPDLIIMDVMMPKMDGFTACRELRARGVTIPVIFLSAKGDIVDKGVGFAAGGDDYMVKPFDPRELMMHIEAHLRRAAMLEVSNGVIASYVHNACKPNLGKIGVLVALESNGDKAKLQELGKHIAMHVAASNPQFLTIADVDQASIDHEKAIFSEQAKASGKPENIIEKMVEGRIKKYFDEVVLEEQAYIMDPDKKVKQIVADAAKEMGADIKLKAFVCFRLGEGLEKRNEDFAAEVASQLKK